MNTSDNTHASADQSAAAQSNAFTKIDGIRGLALLGTLAAAVVVAGLTLNSTSAGTNSLGTNSLSTHAPIVGGSPSNGQGWTSLGTGWSSVP